MVCLAHLIATVSVDLVDTCYCSYVWISLLKVNEMSRSVDIRTQGVVLGLDPRRILSRGGGGLE